VPGYFFAIIPSTSVESIYNLLNNIRAYGTVVWVKLVNAPPSTGLTPVLPGTASGLVATPFGSTMALTWVVPTTGTLPFTYQVLYRVNGTLPFTPGPTVSVNNATVSGLLSGTTYDFEIVTRNSIGQSTSLITTQHTTAVPPSPATNLLATLVQATAVTLTWSAPSVGTPPFTYVVMYRVTGTIPFSSFQVGAGTIGVTVIGLLPLTTYDFEVVTSNV
jgi:hypothetical protein